MRYLYLGMMSLLVALSIGKIADAYTETSTSTAERFIQDYGDSIDFPDLQFKLIQIGGSDGVGILIWYKDYNTGRVYHKYITQSGRLDYDWK